MVYPERERPTTRTLTLRLTTLRLSQPAAHQQGTRPRPAVQPEQLLQAHGLVLQRLGRSPQAPGLLLVHGQTPLRVLLERTLSHMVMARMPTTTPRDTPTGIL